VRIESIFEPLRTCICGRRVFTACEAYDLAAAIIFRSMTLLAASIVGSSVNRRVGVPFSLRNC
jgi:hypothetical protein